MAASTSAAAPTQLLYFADSFLVEADASVLSVLSAADGGVELVLDRTCVYPAGGGQPADAGCVLAVSSGARFALRDARLRDGFVLHSLGSEAAGCFAPGDAVRLLVDGATRLLHARLHSAGHLLDVAVARCGYTSDALRGGKGLHAPGEAWVEYTGKVPPEDQAALLERVNAALAALVAAGGAVSAAVYSAAEAAALCGGSLPSNWGPDSTPRVVVMAGEGCPCGGTHVADVAQVGEVRATSLRVKKGVTRIYYTLP